MVTKIKKEKKPAVGKKIKEKVVSIRPKAAGKPLAEKHAIKQKPAASVRLAKKAKPKLPVKDQVVKAKIVEPVQAAKPAKLPVIDVAPKPIEVHPPKVAPHSVVHKHAEIKKPQETAQPPVVKHHPPVKEVKKVIKDAPVEEVVSKPRHEVKVEEVKKEPVPLKEKIIEPPKPAPRLDLKEIELKLPISVKDLSVKLQDKPSNLIKILMGMRVMAGINQTLDDAVTTSLCEKLGYSIKKALDEEAEALKIHEEKDSLSELKHRAPIVTFMGHVDHGKTSLLDAIRKTKVVDKEHGGITQHIGAYRVSLSTGDITFLDTPGHEAFTAMRARGASVTDMVVLVVAADDGLMPQTQEAIDHARAAGVSIIVALNKIDKPGADVEKVKKQLSKVDLLAEDWGGKVIMVPVSAKTGEGIDNLLEMILLEAQMLELKANPDRLAKGIVIEAKMAKGRGPVATLLIQNGTLHLNDHVVVGSFYGKVRGMFNDRGLAVTHAPASYPVEVLGLSGIPDAGEPFYVFKEEKQAKEIVEKRQEKSKQQQLKQLKHISLEELYSSIKEGKIKELKLIIKADVQGSLEAIKDTIAKIDVQEIKLNIIHDGVGNVNSSDVILAVASDALILGFNIKADDLAKEISTKEGVEIRIYNIIYELATEIKAAVEGMLEPTLRRVFLGRADVRKVFKLSRSGIIAGCFVSKGKINRSASVNLVRNGEVVFEGKISNLKRFKDDVKDVAEGYECGISLGGYDGYQEGDVIEAFEIEKVMRKL